MNQIFLPLYRPFVVLFNKTSANLLEEIESLETFMSELDTDIEIIRKSVELNDVATLYNELKCLEGHCAEVRKELQPLYEKVHEITVEFNCEKDIKKEQSDKQD